MSEYSAIEWTDATWNPTTGCTKISPGCAHCYIERTPAFRVTGRTFVRGAIELRHHEDRLEHPLHWRRPRRVFVNSVSDLFHDDVPDAFIDRVFAVMAQTRRHTYQLLTKRAARMSAYMATMAALTPHARARRVIASMYRGHPAEGLVLGSLDEARMGGFDWPLVNVWLGVSVENQHFADKRIPLLLRTRAAVRFISAEPLLERLQLAWEGYGPYEYGSLPDGLDWVIVGGESGPGARPFEIAWARSIIRQCRAVGVACFVKQLGSDPRDAAAERDDIGARESWPAGWLPTIDGRRVWRPDLVDKKGGDPAEWPDDLRVREFPPPKRVSA